MPWFAMALESLWRNALSVVPLVALVAILCRYVPMRPATRHTLWLIALVSFFSPLVLPEAPQPQWLTLNAVASNQLLEPLAQPTPAISEDESDNNLDERFTRSAEPAPTPKPAPAPRIATNVARPKPSALDWLPVAPGLGGLGSSNSASRSAVDDAAPKAVADRSNIDRPSESDESTTIASHRHVENSEAAEFARAINPPPRVRSNAQREHRQPRLEIESLLSPNTVANSHTEDEGVSAPAAVNLDQNVASRVEQLKNAGVSHYDAPLADTDASAATVEPNPWLVALLAFRDALFRLPPIPLRVWLGGLGLLLFLHFVQVLFFRHRIRKSLPAPKTIARGVRDAAQALGLRTVPETRMTDARVSPLVWCGRRPLLILPSRLWSQLDKHGRRAILLHELAHLRRRDHWVTWLELLTTAVYWWHPLMWFIRRRLHEEADLCCDTWVTWQMPNGRRAYAEALLRAKQYLSNGHTPVPAGGMGVTSVGAKRFARRLTMVMTRNERPGSTLSGAALALAVAATGWLAAPVWSCPPDEKCKDGKAETAYTVVVPGADVQVLAGDAVSTVGTVLSPINGVTPLITTAGTSVSQDAIKKLLAVDQNGLFTTTPGLTLVQDSGDDEGALRAQLERLEADMRRLSDELRGLRAPVERASRTRGAARAGETRQTVINGETISRGYALPQDKLEKMFELMQREDVPVRVSLSGDEIQVSGSAADQEAFAGFVRVLNDDDETISREYSLPEGKRDALYDLLALNSVKVIVSRSGDDLSISATRSQHEAIEAFIRSINPEGGAAAVSSGSQGGSGGEWSWTAPTGATAKAKRAAEVKKARDARKDAEQKAKARKAKVERDADDDDDDSDDDSDGGAQAWSFNGADWSKISGNLLKHNKQLAEKYAEMAKSGHGWAVVNPKDMHASIAKAVEQAAKAGNYAAIMKSKGGAEQYERIAQSLSRQAEAMGGEAGKLGEQISKIVSEAVANELASAGANGHKEIEASIEAQVRKLEAAARALEKKARELEQKARKLESRAGRVSAEELESMAETLAAEADDLEAEFADAASERESELATWTAEAAALAGVNAAEAAEAAAAETAEAGEATVDGAVEVIEVPSNGVQ